MRIALVRGNISKKWKFDHIHRDRLDQMWDYYSLIGYEMSKMEGVDQVDHIFTYRGGKHYEWGNFAERFFHSDSEVKQWLKKKSYDVVLILGTGGAELLILMKNRCKGKFCYYSRGVDTIPFHRDAYKVVFYDELVKKRKLESKNEIMKVAKVKFFQKGASDKLFYPQLLEQKYDVAFVSRYLKCKQHKWFAKKLNKYTDKRFKVVMVGGRYGSKGADRLILGYKNHDIEMTDLVTVPEINDYLGHSKIGAAPFDGKEGYPRVLPEYSMAGLPYVMRKSRLVMPIYHNENTCLLFEDKVGEHVNELIETRNNYKAREYAMDCLTLKHSAEVVLAGLR